MSLQDRRHFLAASAALNASSACCAAACAAVAARPTIAAAVTIVVADKPEEHGKINDMQRKLLTLSTLKRARQLDCSSFPTYS